MRPTALIAALALLGATACATGGASRADLRTRITIQHGRVMEVEAVKLESQAGKNAAIGGIFGALVGGRRNLLAGAAVGAAVGGATTAIAEGSQTAFGYTLRLESGELTKVMVEHGDVAVGQCVAVETGRTTNLRAVSDERCRGAAAAPAQAAAQAQAAQADAQAFAEAQAKSAAQAQAEAEACNAAREAALAATTKEDFDLLERKAKLACGH